MYAFMDAIILRRRDLDTMGLSEKEYWENHWEKVRLPVEITRETSNLLTGEIIRIFDAFLPRREGLSIMEIGGAPGQFLAFFAKTFRYSIHALDYSGTGCRKAEENFEKLNLAATIYNRDILRDDLSDLPRFDIVYSFGFIEHFPDLDTVVAKHLDLLKDEGILMLGVPNYSGVSRLVLKRLAPNMLSMHNLDAMDVRKWGTFERKYNLKPLYRGYIGGFEPRYYRRCEKRTPGNLAIRLFFKLVRISCTDRLRFLRRFNSPSWSAYLLGIYRK